MLNPNYAKSFAAWGNLGIFFHSPPQKIGHSREFLRNIFQDAEKISAV